MTATYIAIVDYRSETGKTFDHIELTAKEWPKAMEEAEKLLTPDVYLVKIAERTGRMVKAEGAKRIPYTETLCHRGHGWHTCSPLHGEFSSTWERADYGSFVDYSIKSF